MQWLVFSLSLFVCVTIFYILLFPMKRFFGLLCTPLHQMVYPPETIENEKERPCLHIEDNATYEKGRIVHFFCILTIYILISFLTSMSMAGIAYLINSCLPQFEINLSLLRIILLYGAIIGISIVAIARISALSYSILPARLLLFYTVGTIGILSLFAVTNYPIFTQITDSFKISFENLPSFILFVSIIVATATELLIYFLRKFWRIARCAPFQHLNELRETYEEQEYALTYEQVSNLVARALTDEINTQNDIKEVLWVTLDGPPEFAYFMNQKIGSLLVHKQIDSANTSKITEELKKRIKVITLKTIKQDLERILPAQYRTPNDDEDLGNFRFIIINRRIAITYFRIPPDKCKPANVGQIIDIPYRVHALSSHFEDWWDYLEHK